MLPPNAIRCHRLLWRRGLVATSSEQSVFNLISIGGLGEVVDSARFDSGDSRGDISISRKYDNTRIGVLRPHQRYNVEAKSFFKAKVKHGVRRLVLINSFDSTLFVGRGGNNEASLLHGTRETTAEYCVIIDDE